MTTDIIDSINNHSMQAKAILQGLSFALDSQAGRPSDAIIQGLVESAITMIDMLQNKVDAISVTS